MSIYDFFRNVFGFRRPLAPADPSISEPSRGNEFKKPVWVDEYVEEDDDILSQQQNAPMFPILSDPLEIHRYFDQQMEYMKEMMRQFSGFPHSSIFDENHSDMFDAIEQPNERSRRLRDEYLKQPERITPSVREDTDLDNRVGAEGMGAIMDETVPAWQIAPALPVPKFRFFGESIITKTVRRPDGTVETQTTKRRSDGTEETEVSVQRPDGWEDVHAQTGLLPRSVPDVFSARGDDGFLVDLFGNFFRRN